MPGFSSRVHRHGKAGLEMALPAGNYTFYFAVDPPDGIPTAELLDSVAVAVE